MIANPYYYQPKDDEEYYRIIIKTCAVCDGTGFEDPEGENGYAWCTACKGGGVIEVEIWDDRREGDDYAWDTRCDV